MQRTRHLKNEWDGIKLKISQIKEFCFYTHLEMMGGSSTVESEYGKGSVSAVAVDDKPANLKT
jgi:hypothetical protein